MGKFCFKQGSLEVVCRDEDEDGCEDEDEDEDALGTSISIFFYQSAPPPHPHPPSGKFVSELQYLLVFSSGLAGSNLKVLNKQVFQISG